MEYSIDELYYKKGQYERLIKNLSSNYNKLESCYSSLRLCKTKIDKNIRINDYCYLEKKLDNVLETIEFNKNKIKSSILPQAKYQYNEIIAKIKNYNTR